MRNLTDGNIAKWADDYRAGRLSRRSFFQRVLMVVGSVSLTTGVLQQVGIEASAEDIAGAAMALPGGGVELPERSAPDHIGASPPEVLRCSFCNKSQNDVRKLIAGPTVFICDECIEVCNDIIADDERLNPPWPTADRLRCLVCTRRTEDLVRVDKHRALCGDCLEPIAEELQRRGRL